MAARGHNKVATRFSNLYSVPAGFGLQSQIRRKQMEGDLCQACNIARERSLWTKSLGLTIGLGLLIRLFNGGHLLGVFLGGFYFGASFSSFVVRPVFFLWAF